MRLITNLKMVVLELFVVLLYHFLNARFLRRAVCIRIVLAIGPLVMLTYFFSIFLIDVFIWRALSFLLPNRFPNHLDLIIPLNFDNTALFPKCLVSIDICLSRSLI